MHLTYARAEAWGALNTQDPHACRRPSGTSGARTEGMIWESEPSAEGVRYMLRGPGCLLSTPTHPLPPSFCSLGRAETRSFPLRSWGVRGKGSAPTPTSSQRSPKLPGLLPLTYCWRAMSLKHAGGLPPALSLHSLPLRLSSNVTALVVRATLSLNPRAHRSLSEHFPPCSQMENSKGTGSVLLISSLLRQECPAPRLAHSRGLGWMDRGGKRNPAHTPTPLGVSDADTIQSV